MTAVRIQPGSAADLAAVMAVMECAFDPAFGEAWSAPQCMGVLDLPGVWLVLARKDERVIGFALSRQILDEAELLLVAVDPGFRGAGVGLALLGQVVADAGRRGARAIHLEMRQGNPAAQLYAKAGFVEVGRRRDYYRGKDGRMFDARTLSRPVATG